MNLPQDTIDPAAVERVSFSVQSSCTRTMLGTHAVLTRVKFNGLSSELFPHPPHHHMLFLVSPVTTALLVSSQTVANMIT